MTLKNNEKQNANKNAKHLIGSSNKIKRARIFIGLVNEDANNVISQWKCSNVIGQSNCLLPILGVSFEGIRRSFVLILPNIGS